MNGRKGQNEGKEEKGSGQRSKEMRTKKGNKEAEER